LGLDCGLRFLEVGLGSGYRTAIARELVGDRGLVVAMEIDPVTFEFARTNPERAGYRDVVLVQRDRGLGYPDRQPYDRIAVTAACVEVPEPLLAQLAVGGRLIAPVIAGGGQDLIVSGKSATRVSRDFVSQVLYVNLRGRYGVSGGSE
jgi:protein-L-isoaspartate(D-aspartate) O-methyltransferase